MQEQLAVPLRLVVQAVAALPRRDVRADQPGLALLDPGERVGQVDLAGADRLDLGPGQHDAGLHRVLDGELVAGAPVQGDCLLRQRGEKRTRGGRTNAGPEGPALGLRLATRVE